MSSSASTGNNIQVAIRVRPLNEREHMKSMEGSWVVDNNMIYLPCNVTNSTFTFDQIFDESIKDNSVIFENVARPIVDATLNGFNGTIFAYGQTSAGKTFTMKGTEDNVGIVPLAMNYIFQQIQLISDRDFNIRCSYLEIYNEVITDLLNPRNANLRIHESLSSGIFVGNLTEEPLCNIHEAIEQLVLGEERRQVGATNANEKSSRSHTLFKVVIESRETISDDLSRDSFSSGPLKISNLTFVDLAGSERVGQTGAEGIRLKEGGHINKSLLALTSVISKLSEGNDRNHIPYRDSKLTRILQPSLGGNAQTAIICALTPSPESIEESLSTLKFASRAKTIENRAHVNEIISDKEQIKRFKEEIKILRCELEKSGNHSKRPRFSSNDFEYLENLHSEIKLAIHDAVELQTTPLEISDHLKELMEELSYMKIESDSALRLITEQTETINILTEQLKSFDELKSSYGIKEEELRKYHDKIEEQDLKCKQLLEEMASVEEALMDDLARMNKENEKMMEEISLLKLKIEQKVCVDCEQTSTIIDQLTDQITILCNVLQNAPKHSDLEDLEIMYQKKIDSLNKEKVDLEDLGVQLKEDLMQRENQIIEVTEKLSNNKKTEGILAEKYENRITELNSELGRLQSEYIANDSQLRESKLMLDKLSSTVERNDEALTILQQELEPTKQLYDEEHKFRISVEKELLASVRCSEDLRRILDENKILIEALNERLAESDRKSIISDKAREEDSVKLSKLEILVKSFEDQLIEQTIKSKEEASEIDDLLKQVTEKQEKIDQYSKLMDTVDNEKTEAFSKIGELQKINEEHEKQLIHLTEFWKSQVSSLQSDHVNEICELNSELLNLSEQLSLQASEKLIQIQVVKSAYEEERIAKNRINQLLARSNEQKEDLLLKVSDLEKIIDELKSTSSAVESSQNQNEVLLRIELERTKGAFSKEKRLLQLRICELEEELSVRAPSQNEIPAGIDVQAKLKRLQEENFRLSQLHQAGLHKIDYYTSLLKNSQNSDKENSLINSIPMRK